jgi:hypothetical protein
VLRRAGDVQELPVDHPALSRGWLAAERDGQALRRWTDGNALLPLPVLHGPATLEVHVAGTCAYPVARSSAAA